MNDSVIIIGAGAAGLMTAAELSASGKEVTVLEAQDRTGGRIHTFKNDHFSRPVELGAEFVHGNLDVTLGLLKKAGISFKEVAGKMFRSKNGEWIKQEEFITGWDELQKKMAALESDMTIADFLHTCFREPKYESLRRSVKGFAEGFDLADINFASTLSLRNEWNHEEDKQYRIDGGYGRLVNYLQTLCKQNGCNIFTNTAVKRLEWKKDEATIFTDKDKTFTANKVIITPSAGILQQNKIAFSPSIDNYIEAYKKIGYGNVIKILLEFNQSFWKAYQKNMGFIFSDQPVPTWWTQLPDDYPLLTGWIGGPNASSFKKDDEEMIVNKSLQSLAAVFQTSSETLRKDLVAVKIIDWSKQPFICGGYSYNGIASSEAKQLLNKPLAETLYFAGEALYTGKAPGTVEAALISGKEVANKVCSHHSFKSGLV